MKVRLRIAYDGSGFRGYARQPGQRTVQGELHSALMTVLGVEPDTSVAGRTDAGVHARGQVVSFSWDDPLDLAVLQRSLNGLVGPEIAVLSAAIEDDAFDARFSATWRRYLYRMDDGPAPDPLTRAYRWHVGPALDWAGMAGAAKVLVGEHDFSSFCRTSPGKSNVRRLESLRVEGETVDARANAFCHQMVRSLVGHLYDVGRGYVPAGSTTDVLAARDRSAVATVAPPHGLVLWEVGYETQER